MEQNLYLVNTQLRIISIIIIPELNYKDKCFYFLFDQQFYFDYVILPLRHTDIGCHV